ncbi:unnamed protein product [Amoebophrya sp. A25]|nr:unnamed protein product [Amoebophrya sp. A25]|eukprot:GSA25T00017709001.1
MMSLKAPASFPRKRGPRRNLSAIIRSHVAVCGSLHASILHSFVRGQEDLDASVVDHLEPQRIEEDDPFAIEVDFFGTDRLPQTSLAESFRTVSSASASGSSSTSSSHKGTGSRTPGSIQKVDSKAGGIQLPVLPPWRTPDDAVEDAVWVRRAIQQYHENVRFPSSELKTTEDIQKSLSLAEYGSEHASEEVTSAESGKTGESGSGSSSSTSAAVAETSASIASHRTEASVAAAEAEQVKREGVFLFSMWTSIGTQNRMQGSLDTWMKNLGPRQAVMIASVFPAQQEKNQKIIRDKVAKGELPPQVFAPVAGHCHDRMSRRLNFPTLTMDGMAGYSIRNVVHLCLLPFMYQVAARIPNLTFLATCEDDHYVLPQPFQLRVQQAFAHPQDHELKLGDKQFTPYPASVVALPGAGLTNTSLLLQMNEGTSGPSSASLKAVEVVSHNTNRRAQRSKISAGHQQKRLRLLSEDEMLSNGTFSASTWQSADPMAMAQWFCAGGMCGQFGFVFNAAATHLLGSAMSHERIMAHVGRWATEEAERISIAEGKGKKESEKHDALADAIQKLEAKYNEAGETNSAAQLKAIARGATDLAALLEKSARTKEQDEEKAARAAKQDAENIAKAKSTESPPGKGASAPAKQSSQFLMEQNNNGKGATSTSTVVKTDTTNGAALKVNSSSEVERTTSGLRMSRMVGMSQIMGWLLKDIAQAHLMRLLWQPDRFAKPQTSYSDFAPNSRQEVMKKTVLYHYIQPPKDNKSPGEKYADHYAAHREMGDHMRANHMMADAKKKNDGKEDEKRIHAAKNVIKNNGVNVIKKIVAPDKNINKVKNGLVGTKMPKVKNKKSLGLKVR